MRCVVVGAGGFIGSAIVAELLRRGHSVAVTRRPGSRSTRLQHLNVTYLDVGEQVDEAAYTRILDQHGTDVLINLGWAGVANFARNDLEQFENIGRADAWAHAAATAGVSHLIGVGSQAEYGPTEGIVDESRPLLPTTRYGVAKVAAGLATRAALLDTGTAFTWVRIFSVYGPGDEPHWMVQAIGEKLLRGEPAHLTPGTQLWDYLYVDDAANAFADIVDTRRGLGFLNLGSGSVHTVRTIVEEMKRLSASSSELSFGAVPFREDQVMHLQADVGALHRATGWSANTPLSKGLELTLSHLRANRNETQ